MSERFQHNGYNFERSIEADENMGPPWKEHDGHGVVSEWRSSSHTGNFTKAPHERILCKDHYDYRTYDIKATMEIALRDKWGSQVSYDHDTPRMIAARAVEEDFRRMKAWCNDEWSWIGVVVRLLDAEGGRTHYTASLWGIESDSPDYHEEVATELADQIIHELDGKTELVTRLKVEEA